MVLREVGTDFRQHVAHLVRLDRQQEDVGRTEHVRVARREPGVGFFGECAASGFVGIAADEFRWRTQPGLQKTTRESGRHFPRAEEADLKCGGHAGGFSSRSSSAQMKATQRLRCPSASRP